MKKTKKSLYFILICILLFIGIIIFTQKNYIIDRIDNYINKEESQDITFEVYSNSDNILKLKVTAKDTEQGINKLIYNSENGKEIQINGYNKKTVVTDYEIKSDGEYTFKFINGAGEKFQKSLVVNDEYRNSLIDIQVSTEKEIDTTGKVSINYNGNEDKTRMYKIGENGQWKEYTGEFIIDAYEILEDNLQDKETKTVKIYAKIEDKAKNTVILSKEIKNIDVDIANEPEIIYAGSDRISVLGKYGVYLDENVEVTINFDERTDITNYYSFNNGVTWNKYTGTIQTKETHIIAKSLKNESGLEISKKQNCNSVLRNDVIPAEAYDEDNDTAIITLNKSIRIDEGLEGYSVKLLLKCPQWNHIYVRFYLEDNTTIVGNGGYWHTNYLKNYLTLTIPENAKWIKIIEVEEGRANACDLYDVNIDTTPIVDTIDTYPYFTTTGITNEEKYKIQYFETAVRKLYSYDEITWYDYSEEGITLEFGDTMYIKSIDKNDRSSIVIKYKDEEDDVLGKEAYDNDDTTKAYAVNKKVRVSDELWNKQIRVKMDAPKYSRLNMRFLNENEEIISEYTFANGEVDINYTIPENTKWIKWVYIEGSGAKGNVYEIELIEEDF